MYEIKINAINGRPATGVAPTIRPEVSPPKSLRSLEVILGLLPLMLGLQLLIWIVYLPAALRGNADFRNCYAAGVILRTGQGHRLYDYQLQHAIQNSSISESQDVLPYVHLSYEALIYAPFSLLPYRSAFLCFLGVNLLLLLLCYMAMRTYFWRARLAWRWLPILFPVSFAPVGATLMQGQDSLISLLLLSTALASLSNRHSLMAGVFVGLVLFKFQLVLPIALLFLLWGNWNFVMGAALSVSAAIGLSAVIVGPVGLIRYVRSLREISTNFTVGGQVLYRMPVARMPNVRGLVLALPHLSSGVVTTLVLIVSACLIASAYWVGRRASAEWQFSISIVAATLVGYHVLTHDLSMLLVPIAVLLNQSEGCGLWTIPMLWLSTPLCFFAHDYLVAVPVILFFLTLLNYVISASPGMGNRHTSQAGLPISESFRAGSSYSCS